MQDFSNAVLIGQPYPFGIETAGIRLIASGVGLLVGAASLLRRIIDYYELSQFLIICGP